MTVWGRGWVAVVAAAALLSAGAAGCGAMRPSTQPRRGGTLTALSSADLQHLDPGQAYYVLDYSVVYATQRPLFAYLPADAATVTPDMAAYMPTISNGGISDGGRTVTVHIRTDVHFSPPVNRAVTSADIAYAIERGANPNVANPYFSAYFGSAATAPLVGAQSPKYRGGTIPGIQTPNSSTIVFHMTRPGAVFLIQALSLPLSAPVPESFAGPLDRHSPTSYGTSYLVATGPYMVKSTASGGIAGAGYEAGKGFVLVRNPNWNASSDYRPAYLNQIDIKLAEAPTVVGEQVLKGSDAIQLDAPAPSIVLQAFDSYRSQVTFTPGGAGDHYVALDNATGPLRNVNARRAIWAALDREAIVRADGGSLFAMPMTHFIYPGVAGYEQAGGSTGPQLDYNADVNGNLGVAERYMRLAGYRSGKYSGRATIEIVGADNLTNPSVTQIVNKAFTSLGFHTRVSEIDGGTMYTRCGTPRFEVGACPSVGWVRDFGDPQAVLYLTFYGPAITPANNVNWGQVNDPQINSAMAQAALLIDPKQRLQAWAEIDRLLVKQAVAIPEVFNTAASIESRDVAGVSATWNNGIWDLDFTSLK